jgi:hypothetical protein
MDHLEAEYDNNRTLILGLSNGLEFSIISNATTAAMVVKIRIPLKIVRV